MKSKIKRREFIKTTSTFSLGIGAFHSSFIPMINYKKGHMVLVENGQVKVPIITAIDAPAEILNAANDLANYIEKICGSRPKVISGTKSIPKSAVWIGVQPKVIEIFGDLNTGFQYPEEILIACKDRHLLIAGRDNFMKDVQIEYGTVNAVYTFLQKYLGVRWLWPGDLGEDIIPTDTIILPSFEYRFHPVFLKREIMALASRIPTTDTWTRYQRLKLDSFKRDASGFSTWWDRFHKDHPDWFALQPDGTRDCYPSPANVKICLSNPEVRDQWIADVEEILKKNPLAKMFSAAANDGIYQGHCTCKSCREWDHPKAITFPYTWKGYEEKYVALTNRAITFCNHVARKLKERFPDRSDLYVMASSYGASKPPPIDIVLEDNIVVSHVGWFPIIGEARRQKDKDEFKNWAKSAKNMFFRPNLWYFTGGVWGLPDPSLKNTIEDFRFLAENKCIGLFVDTAREHWSTQGPQYYIMAQLAWDPLKDGKLVMEDYYRRGFGKASEKIKAYWDLMEVANEKRMSPPDFPYGSAGRFKQVPLFLNVYTDDFFNRAEDLLRQAETLVKDEAEIYRKRVEFVKTGYDFARIMISNIPLMSRIRESKGKDTQALEKVIENWNDIKKLCEKAGPIALNYDDLIKMMQGSGYMGRMEDYFGPPSDKFRGSNDI